jgi:metal-dependent hydrolase (beta-lactamase superfamily II)
VHTRKLHSDFAEDVPTVRTSIEGLGFKYSDTKVVLISHAHGDHDGGVGIIQSDAIAQVMVMEGDVAEVQSTARKAGRAQGELRAARRGRCRCGKAGRS